MAKLADAQRSERCSRKGLEVRVLSSALRFAQHKYFQISLITGKIVRRADVVKWYTRSLEVAVPLKSVEVRVLSSAPGYLAQW